jgi:cytolysin-activating lysine-acyltransferase
MMKYEALQLICPHATSTNKSEAELFGAMVWLWMHSETHARCPLHELHRLLLPALKTGQYVLVLRDDPSQQPLGLMTWAYLNAQAECRYLQSLDRTLQPVDWQQGDRPWIIDWIVPFGHTRAMAKGVQKLLNQNCWRGLYHRGDETGLRVLRFRGADVSKKQESDFWASKPLAQTTNK